MSVDRLSDWVHLFRLSTTSLITWTNSYAFMPPKSWAMHLLSVYGWK